MRILERIRTRRDITHKKAEAAEDRYFTATQRQLIWRGFKRHRLALISGAVLLALYLTGAFCEFFSPYEPYQRFTEYVHAPPQRIRFFDQGKFSPRPFVYGYKQELDLETLKRKYRIIPEQKYYLRFLQRGAPYKMWGVLRGDLHLLGVDEPGTLFLLGADELGRDMLTRILYASRISLSIGLVGVALSFVLGATLGAISGYFGGVIDTVIQRIIEFLRSIPTIPLWMGLSAALPPGWSPQGIYFGITIILSLIGWTTMGRVVRGKFLELRQEEFVMAGKLAGASTFDIIRRHMLPGFMSYLIVSATLAVPRMILAETSLSFLGLGLRPPVISWGVLLQKAQNVQTMALHPWLLLPVAAVVLTVLTFNFVGDGLRDAADPYKSH